MPLKVDFHHDLAYTDVMSDRQVLPLAPAELTALSEIRRRVRAQFAIVQFVLYGSAVRGEADAESDIDLLIVTARPLARPERHKITDIVFHVNLEYGTNSSTLVVDRESWQTGAISVLPIHDKVLREGLAV
ncbi:MAG TPA: nucleotidyltransferase domain-containing protein [Anaerolineae bacterium]|nr:nucleotidyltransferase domain-containing protein [Anaerolineae bacterium]HOQ97326.1 nucleotidyltransferase domain-containing protein [Anaerolineae bacterium]HOQ97343.1 nucleotidyltransferase domain-containing protein [Anaerolineae bacterium]HPL27307.1 nucleotidyltransferase domain-containing protein [Anaerolineae bacterium]